MPPIKKISRRPLSVYLSLGLLLLGYVAPGRAQQYLNGRLALVAGKDPSGVVVADFNGDGKPDLGASNFEDNTVSVFFGLPTGTFGPPTVSATGSSPEAVAAGDFNGDKKADLVVLNANGPSISVLIGNGDGTFQGHVDYPTGATPYRLLVADLNGDGKADIAVDNLGDSTIGLYFGNGDGTFQTPVSIATGSAPEGIVCADLNGDGKPDLITVNALDLNVSSFLNNGDGTFHRVNYKLPFTAGSSNLNMVLGDFDGDGKLDAVISISSIQQFYFLPGRGNGGFGKIKQILNAPMLTSSSGSLAAADLNHDGKLDLVTDGIYTMLGKGDGTFASGILSPGEVLFNGFVLADVNGDGQLDMVGGAAVSSGIEIQLGDGKGKFGTLLTAHMEPTLLLPDGAVAGDFNNDGKLDFASAGGGPNNGQISTQLGKGNGSFQNPISSVIDIDPINNNDVMLTGDFNGDGNTDILIVDSYSAGFEIALGAGDGTFAYPVNTPLSTGPLGVGDFNGDGKDDVVVASGPNLNIFLSNGDGTFTAGTQIPVSFYSSLLVADFNHDGKADIALFNIGSSLQIFLGNGNGTFGSAINGPSASYRSIPVAGDFNGDGKLDLAIGTDSGLAFLAGNADGTFKAPVYTLTLTGITGRLAAGHFAGGTHLDIATYFGSGMALMAGNGDGTFGPLVTFGSTGYMAGMVTGDFNSDGTDDFIIPDQSFTLPQLPVGLAYLSEPVVNLFPSQLTFGSITVGQSSSPLRITLSNTGNAPLRVLKVAASGDFHEATNCQSVLNVGKSCAVQVIFKPASKGERTGSVTITDNAGTPQNISLRGIGK